MYVIPRDTIQVSHTFELRRKEEFETVSRAAPELWLKMMRNCYVVSWDETCRSGLYDKLDRWINENATDLFFVDDDFSENNRQLIVFFANEHDCTKLKLTWDGEDFSDQAA
jgi:hypothetical protein